jgi:hypothetical protein
MGPEVRRMDDSYYVDWMAQELMVLGPADHFNGKCSRGHTVKRECAAAGVFFDPRANWNMARCMICAQPTRVALGRPLGRCRGARPDQSGA